MSRISIHAAPDKEAIERNKKREPLGEQIRAELIDWINRNGIVSVMLDTDEHCVSVDIVKLPPEIKPALTLWGSIYVRNDPESASPNEPEDVQLDVEAVAAEIFKILTVEVCCECGEPRFPQKQQAGDETKVGWPACVNYKCIAYGEQKASASYRTPISDYQREAIKLALLRRVPGKGASVHELLKDALAAPVPATPDKSEGARAFEFIDRHPAMPWPERMIAFARQEVQRATTQGTPEGAK